MARRHRQPALIRRLQKARFKYGIIPGMIPGEEPQHELTGSGELLQETNSTAKRAGSNRPRRRVLIAFLIYLLALILVGAVAFTQGRSVNESVQSEQLSSALLEQFQLGVADLEAGRYEIARQRFEQIIRYDPSYPGAEDMLVEALVHLNVPTLTPTSAPTSTPDPSPPEDLFAQAQTAIKTGDWILAIDKLLALRAKDETYRSVDVDGLMYIALRNRGMQLIANGEMEEGLYNMSLAERFGPLDRDAMFRESLAKQYLLANSYIGLNWGRASELFGPLCEQGATLDSCPKYADAARQYGDQLWNAGDPCGANEQYAFSLEAYNFPELEPTAEHASEACARASEPPPPPPATETPSPTPTGTPEPGDGG
jgi:tetratricopeptide (TPR) repeat protein